jgi:hypothetical protein
MGAASGPGGQSTADVHSPTTDHTRQPLDFPLSFSRPCQGVAKIPFNRRHSQQSKMVEPGTNTA